MKVDIYIPSYLTYEGVETIVAALPGSRNKQLKIAADQIVNKNAYTLPPFGVTKYDTLIKWDEDKSRSYLRLIHGHTFLGCLTDAYREVGDIKYLLKGMDLIRDWIGKHSFETHKETMAYHDETTALRLQYWQRFYIHAKNKIDESDCEMLEKEMWETAALLATEEFHSTNTNHGMFQDIALLLFSLYFKGESEKCKHYKQLSIQRLKTYFSFTFTSEGVHKEHSPSYHMLVSGNVKKVANWLEKIDPEASEYFTELFKQSERYSTFIIRPDGFFPPTCDTEAKPLSTSSYSKLYNSPEYLYAVTKGKTGTPPKETDAVFQKSGYAIFRDDWSKKEKATYVLFTAAYHVDYHKHSDDLNVYIYSDGEIITEAGPNGYNYQDPFTKYAYSSFAHNTLVVDGASLPRTDKQYDKVYLSDYKLSENVSEATGVNERFKGVRHTRNVQYNKVEQRIIVNDNILSEQRHEYTLLWHVAPDIRAHVRDRIVELFRNEKKVMEIEFSTDVSLRLNSIQGQEKPSVQGWVFPKMEEKKEATVIEAVLSGANVECTTEFRLDGFKVGKEGMVPFDLEKQFKSTNSLRYHFIPAADEKLKDRLLVVFSAISPHYSFVYNYMKSLEDVPCNKLFILDDFGDQGSYYIGRNRDYSIETAVSSLIQYIMAKHNILHKNVTALGSSKGGYSALYYGLKYHFGNVIAGGPQSKIGDFLIKQAKHENVAVYIAGSAEEGDLHYLNGLIFRLLEQPNDASPNIHLYVGSGDHHYKNHVIPIFDQLKHKGYHVHLDVEQNINHNDLRTHFPPFLRKKLSEILGITLIQKTVTKQPNIKDVSVAKNGAELTVKCEAVGQGKLEYAYYVYRNGETISKHHYSPSNQFVYNARETGEYMFRIYVRDANKNMTAKNTKPVNL